MTRLMEQSADHHLQVGEEAGEDDPGDDLQGANTGSWVSEAFNVKVHLKKCVSLPDPHRKHDPYHRLIAACATRYYPDIQK